MIEEIIIIFLGLIVFLIGSITMLFIILFFVEHTYYKVKCPYCRNKQEDSSYKKQVCHKCNKEWFEAYNDEF